MPNISSMVLYDFKRYDPRLKLYISTVIFNKCLITKTKILNPPCYFTLFLIYSRI